MRAVLLPGLLLATLLTSLPAHAAPESEAPSASPVARAELGEVTQQSLLESERYWPYHVTLVEPSKPDGREKPLAKGTSGVLIRVERSGMARIDFGRHGLYEVPVAQTDLIQGANQVRKGELAKDFPNFVLAIGPRMLDPAGMTARTAASLADLDRFLCVFADPAGEGFTALAQALASLPAPAGTRMVLFSQGTSTDAQLGERLRSLDWSGSFVLARLARPYTRSLLDEGTPMPFLQLVTSEGRVLFEIVWDPANAPKLTAALGAALDGTSTASASDAPAERKGAP